MSSHSFSPSGSLNTLQENAKQAAQFLQLLGNEHRLLVLCLLAGGEMSVSRMLEHVALSQSALSQHLAKLRDEGIIAYRREAQTLYYRIADPKAATLLGSLKTLFCPENTHEH